MRFKQVFYVPDKKLLEIPNGFIPFRKINYEKAGLDVFLSNAGYIIFSGLGHWHALHLLIPIV